jgi:hypothetical protein
VTAAPAVAAQELLVSAAAAGVRLTLEGGKIRMVAAPVPPAALVTALRQHKPALVALLRGERCRCCGEPISWARPEAVAFADSTAAHLACYEATEVERLLEAGRRATKGAVLTNDDGDEIVTREDEP